jgi:CMP-N-acetylneuraminic acid synthetase
MRAGSKGIPGKNKKSLGGKPLMQYTIESALQSKHLTDVVVSTEDPTLAAMAQSLGAEVPFMRPEALATDTASSIDVVMDALIQLEGLNRHYDAVCLLQVTTPFRTAAHIDRAIEKFQQDRLDALVSVQKVPHVYNPHWVFIADDQGKLKIATGDEQIIKRRQDLPEAYVRDGALYLTKTAVILNQKSFFGKELGCIELENYQSVNLDTEADWHLAEAVLKS